MFDSYFKAQSNERGAGLVEMALTVALIVMISVASVKHVGRSIADNQIEPVGHFLEGEESYLEDRITGVCAGPSGCGG